MTRATGGPRRALEQENVTPPGSARHRTKRRVSAIESRADRRCRRAGADKAIRTPGRRSGSGFAAMEQDATDDHYETLQISASAEPETIHRVYRMLAQRFHPDNQETGNPTRFRQVSDAYQVLSDSNRRTQYDVVYQRQRQDRWRIVATGAEADNDFAVEQLVRATVLEVLYTRRRLEPQEPGIFLFDLEKIVGRPREHLEFTVWYLVQKKLVMRADNALLVITADGVEHLEQHYQANLQNRRLNARNE
jgi:curved DNA-binding protein CbpA